VSLKETLGSAIDRAKKKEIRVQVSIPTAWKFIKKIFRRRKSVPQK
jgi:hypothetical protein